MEVDLTKSKGDWIKLDSSWFKRFFFKSDSYHVLLCSCFDSPISVVVTTAGCVECPMRRPVCPPFNPPFLHVCLRFLIVPWGQKISRWTLKSVNGAVATVTETHCRKTCRPLQLSVSAIPSNRLWLLCSLVACLFISSFHDGFSSACIVHRVSS